VNVAEYGPPKSPPPKKKPPKPKTSYIIDCIHQYTYVWPKRGMSFWFYPTRIEKGEVSGYKWNGKKWIFYGLDEKSISQVACTPVPTLY
jgi:hypothetical protein